MASVFLPMVIAIGKNRRHQYYVRILLFGLIISAITDIINQFVFVSNRWNSAILFHGYTVLEFIIYALLYQHFFHNPHIKKGIKVIIVLFLIFKVIDVTLISNIKEHDTLAMTLESIVMITFGLLYFDQVLKEMAIPNLERYPVFWINSGILIYFSGSLFLFLFSDFIFNNRMSYWSFWPIHSCLTITKNISFAIGLWLQK